jgi:uncharacterized protein
MWGSMGPRVNVLLLGGLGLLSVSFVAATLLAHRFWNAAVRVVYRIASVWLGILNFSFVAACLCWIVYPLALFAGARSPGRTIATAMFSLALLASLYGFINAAAIRVKKITIKLPGLPASWKGRVAALVTDTHLGHVRGQRFMSRIVAKLRRLRADVVFIGGDLFDGTKVDPNRLAAPWRQLSPQFGAYFVTGNHEEFSDPKNFLAAIEKSGVRVLHNEMVTVDGLQIVGVPYGDAGNSARLRLVLEAAKLDRTKASVLLAHSPQGLRIAEEQGISLQLSGHTHGGQVFPFTWLTSRVYGKYAYGLVRHGELTVYTSSGAGTWGPPMRVGTQPEIVLIQFESLNGTAD